MRLWIANLDILSVKQMGNSGLFAVSIWPDAVSKSFRRKGTIFLDEEKNKF